MPFKLEAGLRPLTGKVKKTKVFAFDIETCNNNRDFVCGSIVGENYGKFFTDKQAMINEILSNQSFRSSYLVATNLMFDFYALFPVRESIKHFKITENGSCLVFIATYIKYKTDFKFYKKYELEETMLELDKKQKGAGAKWFRDNFYKITFIDSGNHLRTTVDNLGKIVNMPKLEAPKCMGVKYWDELTYEEKVELKEYNIRDSTITYKFMCFLQDHYNDIGANLKVTVSSTALDLFRRNALKHFWKQEEAEKIHFGYESYYGGRTEAFIRGVINSENYGKIKVYDVSSLYPYILYSCKFPNIYKSFWVKKLTTELIESFEGIGDVTLKAPKDMHIPLVPVKRHKLLFPVGKFKVNMDFSTLRRALNLGYEITRFGKALIYPETFNPFKNTIKKLWNLRNKLKKENNMGQLCAKLLSNSFYGKFGFNYTNKEELIHIDEMNYATQECYPTMFKDIWRRKSGYKIPNYVFPIIPLYVTSLARQHMHKLFLSTGVNKVFYTDTDCIFTTRSLNTGNDLGDLKLENTFDEVTILKPKFYAGKVKDRSVIKVKGVRKGIKDYNDFKGHTKKGVFNVKQTQFRKLRGTIGFANRHVNEVFHIDKRMDIEDDKRIWEKKKFTIKPQTSIAIRV